MKKTLLLSTLLGGICMCGMLFAGCGSAKTPQSVTTESTPTVASSTVAPTEAVGAKEMSIKYKTVTEAEDWGPAITKVILEFGTTIDASSLTKDTFSVSSERKYSGYNMLTRANSDADEIKARTVTDVYVSDATGNKASNGDCVTIEMMIGPGIVEGSPFNYDMASGLNKYVETYYIVSVKEGQKLLDTAGNEVTMATTDATMSDGNINLLADAFDTTGSFDYQGTDGTITLKYASFDPGKSTEKGSVPLIIWLHGAGEGGTDPRIALIGNKVVNLSTTAIQQYFGESGAEILVPQAPTMWMDVDGKGTYNTNAGVIDSCDGKSYYTEALKNLIDSYVSKHPELDTKRIYIGGCSNGGYMTVNMIINYPDYFAAAYPTCEAYSVKWLSNNKIKAIKKVPIWLTAAKTDGTVSIFEGALSSDFMHYNVTLDKKGNPVAKNDFSNALYNRLKAGGAKNVHFSLFDKVEDTSGLYFQSDNTTPYEYNGHFSWIYVLNNECKDKISGKETTIFEWMAKQKR